MKHGEVVFGIGLLLALGVACDAAGELAADYGAASVTIDAFVNTTVGANEGAQQGRESLVDAEVRVLGLVNPADNMAFGARFVYGLASDSSENVGERSVIVLGDFGRFEVGHRRGLPDVLTGYAPNNYQFVSAEFGPASGRSLDPDGGLQTVFLESQIAMVINSLASLGITSSFFFDDSSKIIYVSPKFEGFLAGLSYAPDARDVGGEFGRLVQAGLTYERYRGQNVWRMGGTFAHADGKDANDNLRSASVGASVTLDDRLTLGAGYTDNGDTGLAHRQGGFNSDAFGYALSANYNAGPWTLGGFVQLARHEGDVNLAGDDHLRALELGLSYRINTRVRCYGAGYFYDLTNEGRDDDASDGAVWMAGVRLTL